MREELGPAIVNQSPNSIVCLFAALLMGGRGVGPSVCIKTRDSWKGTRIQLAVSPGVARHTSGGEPTPVLLKQ